MRYLFIILLFTGAIFAQCGTGDWWCTPYTALAFPDDSLVLYYDMDSLTATGYMYNFVGTGEDGTITGSPVDSVGYGSGCSGTCLYFDGINDRIDILPNTVLLLNKQQWMICAWYKSHVTNAAWDRIISQYTPSPD